ncbi:MAG: hypothetical protein KatS3mg012_1533 [Gaiellaceae bacterium]|nr:MAG: hypothetical protein KatS3mg012_1533 [Gaiellaceae bacterium]
MNETDIERDEQEIFARMEAALPRATPPDDLFDRILTEVEAEAAVLPLPRRGRRRFGWRVGAVVAAAALLVVSAGIALRDAAEPPVVRATLEARTEARVTGEAALVAPDSSEGRLELTLLGVPPAPTGHHYEVWVLPEGSDEMISVGTFDTEATRDVTLDFALPVRGPFAAVDVSVEEDDGPAEHSDTSLATGTFS